MNTENIRKIAIYGKGGIGKSTTTSNLSAALAKKGYRVMQIGCDPKADSTKNLMGGKRIPTVLEQIKAKGEELTLNDIVFEGFGGVLCVESGGPTPGVGCAGRGIISAFEKLEELEAFETYKPDIVIYDVLGDVVCGGFAMPIRGGYARLRGLVLNAKNIENEREIVEKAVQEIGTQIVCYVPRSSEIQEAENQGGTVFEFLTDSVMQGVYNELADRILADA